MSAVTAAMSPSVIAAVATTPSVSVPARTAMSTMMVVTVMAVVAVAEIEGDRRSDVGRAAIAIVVAVRVAVGVTVSVRVVIR